MAAVGVWRTAACTGARRGRTAAAGHATCVPCRALALPPTVCQMGDGSFACVWLCDCNRRFFMWLNALQHVCDFHETKAGVDGVKRCMACATHLQEVADHSIAASFRTRWHVMYMFECGVSSTILADTIWHSSNLCTVPHMQRWTLTYGAEGNWRCLSCERVSCNIIKCFAGRFPPVVD